MNDNQYTKERIGDICRERSSDTILPKDAMYEKNLVIQQRTVCRATVEDEKKTKVDEFRNQMKQKWVMKSLERSSQNSEVVDTIVDELGDISISE